MSSSGDDPGEGLRTGLDADAVAGDQGRREGVENVGAAPGAGGEPVGRDGEGDLVGDHAGARRDQGRVGLTLTRTAPTAPTPGSWPPR